MIIKSLKPGGFSITISLVYLLASLFVVSVFILLSAGITDKGYSSVADVSRYGAVGDGKTLNTTFIQKAIDEMALRGGGTVLIPAPGVFVSGTIHLRSNITLEIDAGATLLGSPNIKDYDSIRWGHNIDRQPYHLIYADSVDNISITGKGTIDGNGIAFWKPFEVDENGAMRVPRWIQAKKQKVSPLIEIFQCRNITVKDVTIKTGGGWNLHLYNCDVAKVQGINIDNNLYSPNSDGIDITGSNDVIISDCYIKTCDDAICIKTTEDSREAHRITVNNCIIETLCVGIKLGCNESTRDITDVTISNCIVNKSSRAIGIYVKDGAVYDRINISNIVANTNAPLIFNRPLQIMVNKLTDSSKLGIIRNVTVNNFTCQTEGRIMLTCAPGGLIENIHLQNINLSYPFIEDPRPMLAGSGSAQFPKVKDHPEAVGALAAIVADNIKNLVIENLQLQWPSTSYVPIAWQHPERIENGSSRIHTFSYNHSRQTEYGVLWGSRLQGGYIRAPLATASATKTKKYNITNSTFEVMK